MAEETDQPLSPSGRLFVQTGSDQVINCIIAGKNPIALDSLEAEIQNSVMLKHPRFCSLMLRDRRGRERWRRTAVDVDCHLFILRRRLSDDLSVSNDDAVNDYVAGLTFSSPLWEIHILAAYNAAVFRVHHALGDGISLMSNCRSADDPTRMPPTLGSGASLGGGDGACGAGEAVLVYSRVRGGVCSEGGVAERSENRRERRIRSGDFRPFSSFWKKNAGDHHAHDELCRNCRHANLGGQGHNPRPQSSRQVLRGFVARFQDCCRGCSQILRGSHCLHTKCF